MGDDGRSVLPQAAAVLAEVDRLAERAIWPGFDPRRVPVALYDGECTILAGHPHPPAGFLPLPDRPDLFSCPGRHEAVYANSHVEIDDVLTATAWLDRSPRTSLAALIIHECFHVYQRLHHPDWAADELALFTYPLEDVGVLAARRLESHALGSALSATSRQTTPLVRRALASRRDRYDRLSPGAIAWERGTELNEGLAQYVEHQALGADEHLPDAIPEARFDATAVRLERYGVGEALARLLDRLDPEWKERLEAGTRPLDELLAEAAGPGDAAVIQPKEEAIIRAQSGDDVARLLAQRVARREEFLSADGWRIKVRAESDPLWPQGFDPLNVERVSPSEVLHTRFLRASNDRMSIEVLGRFSLTEAAGEHPLFHGIRRLVVAGLPERPLLATSRQDEEITAPGVSVTLTSARVTTAGRTVTITL